MDVERRGSVVTVSLEPDEASRLAAALTEATLVLSRAEHWMRVGCPKAAVEHLSDTLLLAARGQEGVVRVPLPPGEESQENPRRPRPRRDDPQ
ncbi:hypothetical protein [Kineococcus sp. SYSU DK002]|uniref:hypothetical protein n=1 Tax=Kineococcus sp. SYSU DK002 TaxID=3383123 RepID=UPI003D7F1510